MKRTIEVRDMTEIYHRNKDLGFLFSDMLEWFGVKANGKYRVTITKGTDYKIKEDERGFFDISVAGKDIGFVCTDIFTKLFFKPDGRKRYDIKVTPIKKGR